MANTGYIKFDSKDIVSVILEETADKISVNEQTLTNEQKAQARKNINAVSLESDGCKYFPDGQQVDYNMLLDPGFYSIQNVQSLNGPGFACRLLVFKVENSQYITQFAIPLSDTDIISLGRSAMMRATMDRGASWSEWRPCFGGGDLYNANLFLNIKTKHVGDHSFKITDYAKGDTNTSDDTIVTRWFAYDNSNLDNVNHAFGGTYLSIYKDGSTRSSLCVFKNEADSADLSQISVYYDKATQKYVTYAPTPPNNDKSSQIATTQWVNTNYIPNYGGMIVRNNGNSVPSLYIKYPYVNNTIPNYSFFTANLTKGETLTAPASARYYLYDAKENAQEIDAFCGVKLGVDVDGGTYVALNAFKNEASTVIENRISIKTLTDGTAITYAPTPNLADNSTQIATTAFVNSKTNSKISTTGDRGSLAGYENSTTLTSLSVTQDTQDSVYYNSTSAITCNDGTAGTSWIKVVTLGQVPSSVNLGSGWSWIGGSAPTLVANGTLVFSWQNTCGLANFLSPS